MEVLYNPLMDRYSILGLTLEELRLIRSAVNSAALQKLTQDPEHGPDSVELKLETELSTAVKRVQSRQKMAFEEAGWSSS